MVIWSLRTTPSQATGYMSFFMDYGSEAILLTDLDYGVSKLGHTTNREPRYQQVCDVALLRLAMYQQALRWYHSHRVRGQAFNIRDWCFVSSRAIRTAKSSLCHRRDHTSSWRCSNQAPISSGSSTTKSSSTPGTSNSYVAFTLNLRTLSLISFAIDSSIFSDT